MKRQMKMKDMAALLEGSSRIKSMVWGKCENSVCNLYIAVSKSSRRRKEIRQEDLKIIESDTKECLQIVSFICL